MKFRQNEQNLDKKLKITYAVINILCLFGVLSNSIYDSVISFKYPCDSEPMANEEKSLGLWLYVTLLVIVSVIGTISLFGTATFMHLFILMGRRHKLEFKRVKNTMLVIFFVMTSLFASIFATVTYEIVNVYKIANKLNFSIWITKEHELDFQKLEIYVCWILQIPFVLSCLAIIELKGTKDCLQGIAKLDYLFKVSIFQKYRDFEMEAQKQRIFSSMISANVPAIGEDTLSSDQSHAFNNPQSS